MQPIKPKPRQGFREVVFAKDQPEYLQLPANYDGHRAETIYRFTWRERLRVLFTGCLFVDILTFGHPLQPIRISTVPDVYDTEPEIEMLEPQEMP